MTGRPTLANRENHTGRRVVGLLRPHAAAIAGIALLMLGAAVAWAAVPLTAQRVFDEGLFGPGGRDLSLVARLAAMVFGLCAAAAAIQALHGYLAARLGQRIVQELRETLYRHLQRLSIGFFTTARTGETQARLAHDVTDVKQTVGGAAPQALASTIGSAAAAGAMFLLSWQLALISLAVLPFIGWLMMRLGARQREYYTTIQHSKADLSALAEETLSPGV